MNQQLHKKLIRLNRKISFNNWNKNSMIFLLELRDNLKKLIKKSNNNEIKRNKTRIKK